MAESPRGSADANLLYAFAVADDALHARARAHMQRVGRLRASVPAVLEALRVVRKRGGTCQRFIGILHETFDIDELATIQTAAQALDKGVLRTVFDAYHAAEAHLRGEPLHTADRELLESTFPTVEF